MPYPQPARRPPPFAGLLPALLMAVLPLVGCDSQPVASVRLQKVTRPSLEREQAATRERLFSLHDRAERFGEDPAKSGAEKAAAYGLLGQHYAALRQFEAAAAAFQNAAQAAPETARWFYYQAASLQELGKAAEAAEIYERALKLAPGDGPTVLHLAEMRYELHQLETAAPLFERALELSPGCAAALWGLGKVASERNQWARATELLEKAAAADPAADAIRYSLGQAYRGLGDLQKAQQWLDRSGNTRPRCADPLAEEVGDLVNATAMEVLRARVDQDDFSPRSDIGYALGQLGTVVGGAEKMVALAAADTALRASPVREARWRLLAGALFAHRGQDAAAEPELRRATELDPRLAEAQLRLGNLLARRGDFAGALARYQLAAPLLPGDPELALRRGKVLVNLGRFEEARGDFARAFAGGAGELDAGLELAAIAGHLGRLPEAVSTYRQVIEKAPQERRAREGLATALILLGRIGEAKACLEKAVADLPQETSLRHALARLLAIAPEAGLRDPRRALTLAEAVLAAEPTLDRAETVAMAAAASGDFDRASQIESRLIADTQRAGRADIAARLGARLALYRSGRVFLAQGPGDLIVSPPLLSKSGAEKGAP